MRNELTVTVSGATATGKTAICQIIHNALVEHGIIVDAFPADLSRSPYALGLTIGSLQANGLGVRILEQNIGKQYSTP